ncbi:MAG: kynureninase [Acidimicrobiales bacterium]
MSPPNRADALALDASDELAEYVERFAHDDPQLVYLDGNSLGRLPRATADALAHAIEHEWGRDLVRGWDRWIDMPTQVGDSIAALIGARPGEVIACDSTTVNLYKLAAAALQARPERTNILVPATEFPTDRFVLEGLARSTGRTVVHGSPGEADERTALTVASVVDYRSGAIADVERDTVAAHRAGALVCWDLSHAAGSVVVDLQAAGVDLAVGCTYKHLCSGPGAPAYLYARRELQPELSSPVWGWFAQRDKFAMDAPFDPHPDIRKFLAGTPNVLGLIAVDTAVRLVAEAGIQRLAAKGRALTELVIACADDWLAPLGFSVASPRNAFARGAHVVLAHPNAETITAAAVAAGVVLDARPPDLVRIGPAPISTRFVEVWDGLDRLRALASS